MKKLLFAALLLPVIANAQEAKPEKIYTIKVSESTIQHIAQGVMELPTKIGMPIINDLAQQIQQQTLPVKVDSVKPAPHTNDTRKKTKAK
jgi:hypothetical protein